MKTQLLGGLEPTKYNGRAKVARPSKGAAWRLWGSSIEFLTRRNSSHGGGIIRYTEVFDNYLCWCDILAISRSVYDIQ